MESRKHFYIFVLDYLMFYLWHCQKEKERKKERIRMNERAKYCQKNLRTLAVAVVANIVIIKAN